jgi:hypothetical protein
MSRRKGENDGIITGCEKKNGTRDGEREGHAVAVGENGYI